MLKLYRPSTREVITGIVIAVVPGGVVVYLAWTLASRYWRKRRRTASGIDVVPPVETPPPADHAASA